MGNINLSQFLCLCDPQLSVHITWIEVTDIEKRHLASRLISATYVIHILKLQSEDYKIVK